MLIFEKKGMIKVSYNAEINYTIFDWENFMISLDEIKEVFQKALDMTKGKNCRVYIAETSKVKNVLPPDIIDWWGKEWLPELQKAGVKYIITVVPSSALAKLSTKSWQEPVKVGNIELIDVSSLTDAENYIRSKILNL